MLPGKYCIGILEEDNPLKSYFRLKPLLIENEGKYEYFDATQMYPEEGCIRIVPDKNESSHFKARMRRMGRYCVLDLRDHGGENDKIRPNKNYHGDESEKNAHIVYSDVVREPAPDMIFEIAAFDSESGIWEGQAPGTSRVLSGESLETWRYMPDEEGEFAHIEKDGLTLKEEELQRFEIPGFPGETLHLAVRLPASLPSVLGVPALRSEPAPRIQETPPAPRPQEPAAAKEEKPWISHGHMPPPPPRPMDHQHMSPMQQSIAAQSGLNPRRNRSLQEIIEEKWRHSRVDQLGHPVPAQAMGTPVQNPVEQAMEALRNAWNIPGVHAELLDSLSRMPEFSAKLRSSCEDRAREERIRELEDLEADRLKGLAALDKLRRDKQALRESFKQEIRQEEAAAFKDAVERTNKARTELKKYEDQAEEARLGAEMARDAFAALNDGRFEQKLKDFALTSRAAELLSKPIPEPQPVDCAPAPEADSEEWLRRFRSACAAEGLSLTELQSANLLVSAALSESILLSGPASADKLAVARALAKSFGNWKEISGGRKQESCCADAIVIRDANHAPDDSVCLGLCAPERRVISIVADTGSGFPLSAEALEPAFMIRLQPPGADTPWQKPVCEEESLAPLPPAALKKAILAGLGEPTPLMETRLQQLRSMLNNYQVRLSAGTLRAMWSYCAAMLSLSKAAPMEILDLAIAQKALPCILAEAPVDCLKALKTMLADLPKCLALLEQPLPIMI